MLAYRDDASACRLSRLQITGPITVSEHLQTAMTVFPREHPHHPSPAQEVPADAFDFLPRLHRWCRHFTADFFTRELQIRHIRGHVVDRSDNRSVLAIIPSTFGSKSSSLSASLVPGDIKLFESFFKPKFSNTDSLYFGFASHEISHASHRTILPNNIASLSSFSPGPNRARTFTSYHLLMSFSTHLKLASTPVNVKSSPCTTKLTSFSSW